MNGLDFVDNEVHERFNGDWHRMRMGAATTLVEKLMSRSRLPRESPRLQGGGSTGVLKNSASLRPRTGAVSSAGREVEPRGQRILECVIKLQSEHSTALARVDP